MMISPPSNETELLARVNALESLTFAQLATGLGVAIPMHPLQRKGWIGQAIELVLGTTAGNRAAPDFCQLGIELKTLPVNTSGRSAESTFVSTIPLLTIHKQVWKTSTCFAKLKRVLWIPIEGDTAIAFPHRRIGRGIIWSPSMVEENILCEDWSEVVQMISTGRLAEVSSSHGNYLQVRPKAAHGKSLCYHFNETGDKVLTLPRGFYLRSHFTTQILGTN